jgi:hypothetical protein
MDRERPQRDARTAEEIELRPLTFVLTIVFSLVSAFGLIYTFAFSDTADERWAHFYIVFSLAAVLGTSLAFSKRREDRSPLTLATRRKIWGGILLCYALAFAVILKLGASPFTHFIDTVRLLCYLGSTTPLAYAAWRLIGDVRQK